MAATCCSQCGMIAHGMNTPEMKNSGMVAPMTTGWADWIERMNPVRANPMQQNAVEPITTEAASDGRPASGVDAPNASRPMANSTTPVTVAVKIVVTARPTTMIHDGCGVA